MFSILRVQIIIGLIILTILTWATQNVCRYNFVLDKKKKLIEEVSSSEVLEMIKNETITGGMIPKINTCIKTVQDGAEAAVIMDGRKKHSLLVELFTEDGVGTLIKD